MKLYNTLSRQVEELKTLEPGKVRLYTCGLTVYSQPHIGNWVSYIYWDILVRVLKANEYSVQRTQNITDVGHLVSDDDEGEDKMQKGANREGISAWDIAKKYSQIAEVEAYEVLGLLRPDNLVAATDYIDQQIKFAKKLDEDGLLYRTDDGMYFDTSKLSDYGKLAKLDIEGLKAGARVATAGKKNPTDFAVWKFSPADSKRDMEWRSPWGVGFPGWHLECSVIALETLGEQIDIHTGGIDHIPVHHTNEIAQTESYTKKPFAITWMHNNHIKIDGTKVSKSLGNIYTLDNITQKGFDIDAFKLMVLSRHYRTEGNFSWEILESFQNRLNHWRQVAELRHQSHDTLQNDDHKDSDDVSVSLLAANRALVESLSDDLNTPATLTLIDEAFSRFEKLATKHIHQSALSRFIVTIDEVLGLRLMQDTPDIDDETKRRILERERARESRDWAKSDGIRDELLAQGIALNDFDHGTTWSKKR